MNDAAAAGNGDAQFGLLALLLQTPDGGGGNVGCRCGGERIPKAGAAPVILAKIGACGGRIAGDRAIDLAAGLGVFIEDDGVEAELGAFGRGSHAGRAGADDGDIVTGGKVFGAADRLHCHLPPSSVVLAPLCEEIVIPSWTGTMQACRFWTPSMVTRHSKQMPIMQ